MLIDYKAKVAAASKIDHIGFRVVSGREAGCEIILRPGVQSVDAEAWKRVRTGAAIGWDEKAGSYTGHLIESGALKILEDDTASKTVRWEVAKLTPSDVRELVARTTIPALLREWQAALAKKDGTLWEQVRKDIEAQILAVTTDANGQPAEPRSITLPATANG